MLGLYLWLTSHVHGLLCAVFKAVIKKLFLESTKIDSDLVALAFDQVAKDGIFTQIFKYCSYSVSEDCVN